MRISLVSDDVPIQLFRQNFFQTLLCSNFQAEHQQHAPINRNSLRGPLLDEIIFFVFTVKKKNVVPIGTNVKGLKGKGGRGVFFFFWW